MRFALLCASATPAYQQTHLQSHFAAPSRAGSVLPVHAVSTQGREQLAARSGVRSEEAIALLRRFYAQENQGAPVPQKRTKKQLELAEEVMKLGRAAVVDENASQVADGVHPGQRAQPER